MLVAVLSCYATFGLGLHLGLDACPALPTRLTRIAAALQVWDQTFKFILPAERPGEHAPMLRVTVMNSNRLLPDRQGSQSAT